MISRGLAGAVVASLVVVGIAAAATGGDTDVKRKPKIELVDDAPLVVYGSGFAARERVTVKVMVGGDTYAKRLRATLAGTFTARIVDAPVANCEPLSIVAVGAAGSRATLTRKFQIPPPCGISPQPGGLPTVP